MIASVAALGGQRLPYLRDQQFVASHRVICCGDQEHEGEQPRLRKLANWNAEKPLRVYPLLEAVVARIELIGHVCRVSVGWADRNASVIAVNGFRLNLQPCGHSTIIITPPMCRGPKVTCSIAGNQWIASYYCYPCVS